MTSFLVTVKARIPKDQFRHPADRAYNPEGLYGLKSSDLKTALTLFPSIVPIGCPEDFEIVAAPSTEAMDIPLRRTQEVWAHHWFSGREYCPRCGCDEHPAVPAGGEGQTLIQEYRCGNMACPAWWRVEQTATRLLPYDEDRLTYEQTDWIEAVDVGADAQRAAYRGLAESVNSIVRANFEELPDYLEPLDQQLAEIRSVDPGPHLD